MTEQSWDGLREFMTPEQEARAFPPPLDSQLEWMDSIGGWPNLAGQDDCNGCGGGPCVWATHIYPEPATPP